jgi:hypothetical protein
VWENVGLATTVGPQEAADFARAFSGEVSPHAHRGSRALRRRLSCPCRADRSLLQGGQHGHSCRSGRWACSRSKAERSSVGATISTRRASSPPSSSRRASGHVRNSGCRRQCRLRDIIDIARGRRAGSRDPARRGQGGPLQAIGCDITLADLQDSAALARADAVQIILPRSLLPSCQADSEILQYLRQPWRTEKRHNALRLKLSYRTIVDGDIGRAIETRGVNDPVRLSWVLVKRH